MFHPFSNLRFFCILIYYTWLFQHRASVCHGSWTENVMMKIITFLLIFPSEVSLQIIQKMNLVGRINLSRTDTWLSSFFFHRSLKKKSTEALTLYELRQLYGQSRDENERDQCFKSNVLDKILIKNKEL